MRDNSKTVQPGTFGELFSDIVSGRQAATVHEQHIFSPNLLNVAQIGFSRAVGIQGKVSSVVEPAHVRSLLRIHSGRICRSTFNTCRGSRASWALPPRKDFSRPAGLSTGTRSRAATTWFSPVDRHTLKFGAEVERMQDNEVSASNINGAFRFDSLAQFLTNQPTSFSGTASILPPDIGMRQTLFGAYVQDDIRLQKTLTLNAGLRYEMVTVPTEAHDRTSDLRNLTDAQPSVGTPLFSQSHASESSSRAWALPGIRAAAKLFSAADSAFLMCCRCRTNLR